MNKIKHTKQPKKKESAFTVSFGEHTISWPRERQERGKTPANSSGGYFEYAEEQVKSHLQDFLSTGLYLQEIKQHVLYPDTYASFWDYFHDLIAELEQKRTHSMSKTESNVGGGASLKSAQEHLNRKNKKK